MKQSAASDICGLPESWKAQCQPNFLKSRSIWSAKKFYGINNFLAPAGEMYRLSSMNLEVTEFISAVAAGFDRNNSCYKLWS